MADAHGSGPCELYAHEGSSPSLGTKRIFPGRLAAVLALVAAAVLNASGCRSTETAAESGATHPNVVVILTDDQGWGDLGSHGNPHLDTPRLDALAATAVRFERFYVSPVCAPTRASLLTGRYSLRTGTHGVTRGRETLRAEEITIAERFRAAGYATGCFGKWHNGRHGPYHPNAQGFDEFFGFAAGHWNHYFDAPLERNGEPVATSGYITDVLTSAAIDFIREHCGSPFFCYVPLNAPHSPWRVPDAYFEKYARRGLDPKTACAYAMCENIDDNVGRILDVLEELDLAGSTIVLYLTDNGPNNDRYNGGMRGRKGSVHEGGVRVPLLLRAPGRFHSGLAVREIAAHIDILPTLAELCGVPIQDAHTLDGASLVPLLDGHTAEWPDRLLFTTRSRNGVPLAHVGAVRSPEWRAVRAGADRGWELYDMRSDPGERRDLARRYPNVARRLAAAFDAHFEEVTPADIAPPPIPIGWSGDAQIELPAHEANLEPPTGEGGIRYHGRFGFAHDWIDRWTSTDAYAWWDIDVETPGEYSLGLRYALAPENVGCRLRVDVPGDALELDIGEPHALVAASLPDRAPRRTMIPETWALGEVGTIQLRAGRQRLTVNTLEIKGRESIALKGLVLTRVETTSANVAR